MTQCVAWIEDYANGTSYIQGFTVPKHRQCSKRSTKKVGTLDLCTVHARLAHEGFIDEGGNVEARSVIQDCKRYDKGAPHSWAQAAVETAQEKP